MNVFFSFEIRFFVYDNASITVFPVKKTLFEIKYFDEKAYLSQSAQLYLEAMIFSLQKVWALTPSFRAEPSKTNRHLTELEMLGN